MVGEATRWKPGQSGNPGGRPREVSELRKLAREYTKDAIETLAQIMVDVKASEASRIAAANSLLDRGYGRPLQAVDLDVSEPISSIVRTIVDSAQPLPPAANGAGETEETAK